MTDHTARMSTPTEQEARVELVVVLESLSDSIEGHPSSEADEAAMQEWLTLVERALALLGTYRAAVYAQAVRDCVARVEGMTVLSARHVFETCSYAHPGEPCKDSQREPTRSEIAAALARLTEEGTDGR